MAFNGSGTYNLPAGNPVVTGTTISSTTTNTTNSDIATALTNCITRDGQSTPSANLPMNAKKLTGLAAGTTAGDSVRYEQVVLTGAALGTPTSGTLTSCTGLPLTTGVTGTLPVGNGGTGVTTSTGSGNNVLSTSPTLVTPVLGTPSSGDLSSCTNAVGYGLKSATTTVSVSAATAPTAGQALVATSSTTATWQSPASGGITMGTPVVSTSGTAITFTGIPAGTKRITIMLVDVSTDGTSEKRIQIGDSGGLESTGYLSVGIKTTIAGTSTGGVSGDGFVIFSEAAADVLSGSVILSLENSSTNSWVAQGLLQGRVGSNAAYIVAGNKSLSSVLTQISVNTPAANNFDAGEINISYE